MIVVLDYLHTRPKSETSNSVTIKIIYNDFKFLPMMRSNNKGPLLRFVTVFILLLVASFVIISIFKIIISQSLFFIRAKYGDTVVCVIVGLFVLSQVIIYIVKFLRKRNQDSF